VRPRRSSVASGRPLNFTVRRMYWLSPVVVPTSAAPQVRRLRYLPCVVVLRRFHTLR
jgi:hypothetical protein